jgi:ABC-type nitrate/sulfonate/bicarbonate transport system permease component
VGLRAALSQLGYLAVTLLVIGFGWVGGIWVFDLNSYFAKGPVDLWRSFVTDSDAAASREVILDAVGVTVLDAGAGLLVGTVVAFLVAIVFVLWPDVESALMPSAIALRSMPLVAMTPVIVLTLGRNLLATVVIAALVTFFPTLVNFVLGMRSTSDEMLELMRGYDASKLSVLVKIRIPSALPHLFAALKIAAPAAVLAAVVAEWLATGQGLGYVMVVSPNTSRYDLTWGAGVVVTVIAAGLYGIISLIEVLVGSSMTESKTRVE